MQFPSMEITLTVTLDQLRAIERGINTALRELAQQPTTKAAELERSSLWDMRNQIDRLLTEKAEAFKAYDAEHQRQQRQGDNSPNVR